MKSAIEEPDCAGHGGGLLCRHLFGTKDEAAHPLREAADHLPAFLRHSTLPLLYAGRWTQANCAYVVQMPAAIDVVLIRNVPQLGSSLHSRLDLDEAFIVRTKSLTYEISRSMLCA